jgi:acetoin utilization protein AcuB
LPVVDHGGRLVGIVTDRDLRQVTFALALQRRLPKLSDALKTLTVQEVMTRGVVTVRPSAEIREAARLMYERKIGALPVVDGDRIVGILTESDVLRALQSVLTEGVLAKPHRWALAYR